MHGVRNEREEQRLSLLKIWVLDSTVVQDRPYTSLNQSSGQKQVINGSTCDLCFLAMAPKNSLLPESTVLSPTVLRNAYR